MSHANHSPPEKKFGFSLDLHPLEPCSEQISHTINSSNFWHSTKSSSDVQLTVGKRPATPAILFCDWVSFKRVFLLPNDRSWISFGNEGSGKCIRWAKFPPPPTKLSMTQKRSLFNLFRKSLMKLFFQISARSLTYSHKLISLDSIIGCIHVFSKIAFAIKNYLLLYYKSIQMWCHWW